MDRTRLFTYLLFLSFSFISCNETSYEVSSDAFIGGKLVNPKSDYVVLTKGHEPLDTIPLDENNQFSYRIKDLEAGDYAVKHHSETQTIYLTPGDSISMYANTLEFDESLFFSGRGAEENNFLINLFLRYEENTDLILSYDKIEPVEFEEKTDSIHQERRKDLERMNLKHGFPEKFLRYAQEVINYENYDLKERYTYIINKYSPEFSDKFPDDFHSYREKVDFNEETLKANPAYLRFIGNFLVNKALSSDTLPSEGDGGHNLYDHENIKQRIHLVDSLTNLPLIKNYFYSNLGSLGMIMAEEREEMVSILTLLARKGYSREGREELRQLGTIQLAFLPGMTMTNIPVLDHTGKKLSFADIISKQTILYIWSVNSPEQSKDLHSVMNRFQKKYPEIDFIGINIDVGRISEWQTALRENSLDVNREYQLDKTSIEDELFRYYLNKIIFLDANGEVIVGDSSYNAPEFEDRIQQFLNN